MSTADDITMRRDASFVLPVRSLVAGLVGHIQAGVSDVVAVARTSISALPGAAAIKDRACFDLDGDQRNSGFCKGWEPRFPEVSTC